MTESLIFVQGKPGAGKSTASKFAVAHREAWANGHPARHLSVGERFRAILGGTCYSALENEVKAAIESANSGSLPASLALPSHLLVHRVVGEFLDQQGEQSGVTLIDGYPKEIELIELIEQDQAAGRINVAGVVEVQVSDEVAVKRQLARNGLGDNHPECKWVAALERVEHHNVAVSPVITELSRLGVLLTVQGNQVIGGVHVDFVKALQKILQLARV